MRSIVRTLAVATATCLWLGACATRGPAAVDDAAYFADARFAPPTVRIDAADIILAVD